MQAHTVFIFSIKIMVKFCKTYIGEKASENAIYLYNNEQIMTLFINVQRYVCINVKLE
jgi:hypothetical protein